MSSGGSAPTSISEQLAALGPYFAADSHDPSAAARDPWRPMSELLDDPNVLSGRVDTVRTYLAAAGGTDRSADSIELRVAASMTHLGLAARALSPLFALNVMGRRPFPCPIGIRDLRWQPTLGSMFPLSIPDLDLDPEPEPGPEREPGPELGRPDRPASTSSSAAMDLAPLAAELCAAVEPFGVSPRVLWGNIASALNGARVALSSANPALAVGAASEVGRLLSEPPLAGTAQARPDGGFRRLSCCLIYRAAPDHRGPLCGDCILTAPPRRRRRTGSA